MLALDWFSVHILNVGVQGRLAPILLSALIAAMDFLRIGYLSVLLGLVIC